MRLRNNIFAAAFDYLKRDKGIKTQKKLAELMGVSASTPTSLAIPSARQWQSTHRFRM